MNKIVLSSKESSLHNIEELDSSVESTPAKLNHVKGRLKDCANIIEVIPEDNESLASVSKRHTKGSLKKVSMDTIMSIGEKLQLESRQP